VYSRRAKWRGTSYCLPALERCFFRNKIFAKHPRLVTFHTEILILDSLGKILVSEGIYYGLANVLLWSSQSTGGYDSIQLLTYFSGSTYLVSTFLALMDKEVILEMCSYVNGMPSSRKSTWWTITNNSFLTALFRVYTWWPEWFFLYQIQRQQPMTKEQYYWIVKMMVMALGNNIIITRRPMDHTALLKLLIHIFITIFFVVSNIRHFTQIYAND
jgi:hypothetical protein